jgi:tetratricopeptide (TPR) repeat protein
MEAVWKSPAFRKAFLGTYGVRTDIEPAVAPEERVELEKVLALMASPGGRKQAKILLYGTITPAHGGVFDFTLGNLYFQEDNLEHAAHWYRRAIDKFPGFLRAQKNLGIVLVRLGRHEEAAAALARAVELGAHEGLVYGMLGYACGMLERDLPAESAYRQAILLQPATLDWQLGLARVLFRQRRYEEAAALCDELVRKDPGRIDYWLLEANAFLGLRQPLAAAANYEHLMRLGKLPPEAMNSLGDIYVNERLYDIAAAVYTNVLASAEEPDASRALRNAEVFAQRNAPGPARRILDALKARVGGEMPAEAKKRALKLEARLAALEGRPGAEQALALEAIVKEDPLDGEALIALGRHHAANGQLERGVFFFERAAGIEAFEAEASLRHGQILARAGRFAEALPLLRRAQDLNPRDTLARYIEQVERMARARR